MDLVDVFGGFVKAADLRGQEKTVTISGVSERDFPNGGGDKIILEFSDAKKDMVVNITNANMIASFLGGIDIEHAWVGKQITLYPTTTMLGTEVKDCIRVRPPAVQAAAPPPPPPPPPPVAAAPPPPPPPPPPVAVAPPTPSLSALAIELDDDVPFLYQWK